MMITATWEAAAPETEEEEEDDATVHCTMALSLPIIDPRLNIVGLAGDTERDRSAAAVNIESSPLSDTLHINTAY